MFFFLADALWLSGNVSERYSSLVYLHPPYHESASEENRGEDMEHLRSKTWPLRAT